MQYNNENKCIHIAHIASRWWSKPLLYINSYESHNSFMQSIIFLDCIQSKHMLSKANITQVVMIGNRCFPRQFSALSMMSNCF